MKRPIYREPSKPSLTMNELNPGTRIATMLLDHFIMTALIMVIVAPALVYDMIQTFSNQDLPPKIFMGNYYLNILGFSLYFNKDIYLGRSPAKRILKLQVVNARTNLPANPLRCLVRNITTILWPIEVIVSLINNQRRIGDFIAGTKLTTYDPEFHKREPSWILVVIAIPLSVLITYLVMFYPIELLIKSYDPINGRGL